MRRPARARRLGPDAADPRRQQTDRDLVDELEQRAQVQRDRRMQHDVDRRLARLRGDDRSPLATIVPM
jgi:hypothetical protein